MTTESIAQFLARGKQIQRVAVDARRDMPDEQRGKRHMSEAEYKRYRKNKTEYNLAVYDPFYTISGR